MNKEYTFHMDEKMKRFMPLFILLGIIIFGLAIYITFNHIGMATRTGSANTPADFWMGLWQGAIIFLSFVASWFDNDVVLYQVNNNGFWYNLGYFVGIAIAVGGSAKGSRKNKHKNIRLQEKLN